MAWLDALIATFLFGCFMLAALGLGFAVITIAKARLQPKPLPDHPRFARPRPGDLLSPPLDDGTHPMNPLKKYIMIGVVMLYCLSPLDLLPDAVPGLGALDDVILAVIATRKAMERPKVITIEPATGL